MIRIWTMWVKYCRFKRSTVNWDKEWIAWSIKALVQYSVICKHLYCLVYAYLFFFVIMNKQRSNSAKKIKNCCVAESAGIRQAAGYVTVNEANIRSWKNTKATMERMHKYKKNNSGKFIAYPTLEEVVMQWVKEKRERGVGISHWKIRIETLKLKKLKNYKYQWPSSIIRMEPVFSGTPRVTYSKKNNN